MMTASILEKPKTYKSRAKVSSTASKTISLHRFLNMPKNEDGYKYELVAGILEKSNHNMTTNELKIVKKIRRLFLETQFFFNGGEMEAETKIVLSQNPALVRIPDISFFTATQIKEASETNFPIPAFVIELISSNDGTYRVEKKILEYFAAGIKVIWVIYPLIKQVKVYTSPKAATINYEDDICSATPVMEDMKMSVNEMFKLNL